MSRYYDVELECGCLTSTTSDILIPCSYEHNPKCKFKEWMDKRMLEISEDDTWKPCIKCGGELTQIRKALFTCLKCNQEYIADEQDMRREDGK